MAKLLIVGYGKVAHSIASLISNDFKVFGLRRSIYSQEENVELIKSDIFKDKLDEIFTKINPDFVLYSVAADEQSPESYENAYVNGLKKVIQAAEKCQSVKHLFFLSSTRVYGQTVKDRIFSEIDPPTPIDFGGHSLLRGEELTYKSSLTTTIIRLSGIYGCNRNYLIRMALDSKSWPTTNRWTNRIHENDVTRFFLFLLNLVKEKHIIAPLYLLTDEEPAPLYEVLNWIREKSGLSKIVVKNNDVIEGKRLKSGLIDKLSFQLKYPNYISGYGMILEHLKSKKT